MLLKIILFIFSQAYYIFLTVKIWLMAMMPTLFRKLTLNSILANLKFFSYGKGLKSYDDIYSFPQSSYHHYKIEFDEMMLDKKIIWNSTSGTTGKRKFFPNIFKTPSTYLWHLLNPKLMYYLIFHGASVWFRTEYPANKQIGSSIFFKLLNVKNNVILKYIYNQLMFPSINEMIVHNNDIDDIVIDAIVYEKPIIIGYLASNIVDVINKLELVTTKDVIIELFKNVKYIICGTYGSQIRYVKKIREYFPDVEIINPMYASTESFMGTIYDNKIMLLPDLCMYSFYKDDKCVDMNDLILNEIYNITITTYNGLINYKMGDSLKYVGNYGYLPLFDLVGRSKELESKMNDIIVKYKLDDIGIDYIIYDDDKQIIILEDDTIIEDIDKDNFMIIKKGMFNKAKKELSKGFCYQQQKLPRIINKESVFYKLLIC